MKEFYICIPRAGLSLHNSTFNGAHRFEDAPAINQVPDKWCVQSSCTIKTVLHLGSYAYLLHYFSSRTDFFHGDIHTEDEEEEVTENHRPDRSVFETSDSHNCTDVGLRLMESW